MDNKNYMTEIEDSDTKNSVFNKVKRTVLKIFKYFFLGTGFAVLGVVALLVIFFVFVFGETCAFFDFILSKYNKKKENRDKENLSSENK